MTVSTNDLNDYTICFTLEGEINLNSNIPTKEAVEAIEDMTFNLDCQDEYIEPIEEITRSKDGETIIIETNGYFTVEANNEEEAEEKAKDVLDAIDWNCNLNSDYEDFSNYQITEIQD